MIKIFNDRYELLEFKKKNIYDFTSVDVIIIKFDFETKCMIKANKILCYNLSASYISCTNISSIIDIVCYSIKANNIICNNLIGNYITANNIIAVEIKVPNNITSFSICCDTILSLEINCHYIKCDKCFTNFINAREDHINYLYEFNEYCV